MTASSTLAIDVILRRRLPWCYIGKRLLEQAIASKPDIAVEVRFRPYFLNPWVPREGMSREDYLDHKNSARSNATTATTTASSRRRPPPARLQSRPHQAPTQHARLPSADSMGGRNRPGGGR